jgi:NAD(P)H-dependent FMN reductase
MLNIPVILGTARRGRQSEKVARYILEKAREFGFESELIDVREYIIPATDNTEEIPQAKKLSQKIRRSHGLIVVSPEYNRGYPGELKIVIDMLYEDYARKPVGIIGVSMGGLGGSRVVEQLRTVFLALKMVPISEVIYFSRVQDMFDKEGRIREKSYDERVRPFLQELEWYAKALKAARENK